MEERGRDRRFIKAGTEVQAHADTQAAAEVAESERGELKNTNEEAGHMKGERIIKRAGKNGSSEVGQ